MNQHARVAAAAGAWPRAAWFALGMGLLVLYVPTYLDVNDIFWSQERGAHGPIILALIGWLAWRERSAFGEVRTASHRLLGVSLFALGLLLYVLGRSQSFYQFEVGSQLPLLSGLVLLLLGAQGIRRLWFPILLLLFVIPVPGSLVDQLLLPLKDLVSGIVDAGLHALGYPIARNGVVLTIGPYDLLIADACSGLNSMVALSGVGLLYVYASGQVSWQSRLILLLAILPIAFIANIVRVTVLVLLTYHGGERIGHLFHDFAGYLEIALAFGAFFALDRLIKRIRTDGPDPPLGTNTMVAS